MPKTKNFLPKNRKLYQLCRKNMAPKTGVSMWNLYDRPHGMLPGKKNFRRNHPFLWVVVEELKKQEKITRKCILESFKR